MTMRIPPDYREQKEPFGEMCFGCTYFQPRVGDKAIGGMCKKFAIPVNWNFHCNDWEADKWFHQTV